MATQNTILIQDYEAVAALMLQAILPKIDAMQSDEVFTVGQAAAFAQMSRAEIDRAINSGELPARKVGGGKERERWRVMKSEVIKYLKKP